MKKATSCILLVMHFFARYRIAGNILKIGFLASLVALIKDLVELWYWLKYGQGQ